MSLDSDFVATDMVVDAVDALTARGYTCPDCGGPLVSGRVYDFENREAILGVVCTACDQPYRVRDVAS